MTLLERLRVDRGLSQFEVEQASGVNHKTLVKYEQALTDRLQFNTLGKLGRFYGVPASDLLIDIRQIVAEREAVADAA
jgi:transcriptional regulator with XRE-family HTH domain